MPTPAHHGAPIPAHDNDSDVTVPQVSVVVGNLEEGMRLYSRLLGWERWTVLDFRELGHVNAMVEGKPQDYTVRVALTHTGGADFELIEPIGAGPYRQYLDTHGPGLHHIQLVSPSADGQDRLARRAAPVLCSGEFEAGAGEFGYRIFDATPGIPVILGTYTGDPGVLAGLPARDVTVRDGIITDAAPEPASAPLAELIQVGIVVPDVRDTLRELRRTVGWGPWRVFDFRQVTVRDRQYRGRPHDYAMHIATVRTGDIHIELLSPTGPGPYQDFLDEFGPGLHHIQVRGQEPAKVHDRLRAAGATVQFSGRVAIDDTEGLDYWLFEGAGLPHLVEVTVGDRGRLMDTVTFDLVSGD